MSDIDSSSSIEANGGRESPCGTPRTRFASSSCCREFQNALSAILDLIDAERSAAADREKRLLSRIDQLSQTVQGLSTAVMETNVAKIPTKMAEAKKTKRKKAAKTCCASIVHKSRTPSSSTSCDGFIPEAAGTIDEAHSTVRDTSMPAVASACDAVISNTNTCTPSRHSTSPLNIPNFEESLEDDSWKTIISKQPAPKKKVLYVGNLRPDVTEDGLKSFLSRRAATASPSSAISIFQCTVFRKIETSSARIVVNAKSLPVLRNKQFWPRPAYTRAWNFEKYNDSYEKMKIEWARKTPILDPALNLPKINDWSRRTSSDQCHDSSRCS